MLGHTLEALRKSGCEAVAINLHHLGEKIAARFGSDFDGMPIRYSREEDILGTLGALAPLRDFLAEAEHTVVINGDSLARWPLAKLLRLHEEQRPRATLMVTKRAAVSAYGGGIAVDREGQVVSFFPARNVTPDTNDAEPDEAPREDRRRVFAGAHVFSRELLEELPDPPADFVRDLYQPLVESGERIRTLESSVPWFDIGTPKRYLEAAVEWAGKSGWRRPGHRGGWWNSEVDVAKSASVKKSVLEAGVQVGEGAKVRRALIMTGASIGTGGRVVRSIIGPSVRLPAGTVVENRLITEARADTPPDDRASVVGGLVYGPLE